MTVSDSVVIFNAYAWVEYALDSSKAEKVAELLEKATEAITPASVLAELKESTRYPFFRNGPNIRLRQEQNNAGGDRLHSRGTRRRDKLHAEENHQGLGHDGFFRVRHSQSARRKSANG
jgi:hypothetical protein